MWHRSMTNVRPLGLVIVCSTGADYGSLHAPLCVCVCVGGGGETDRQRAICRTLICDSKLSVEVPLPLEPISLRPAAGQMRQLFSDLIAEHFSFFVSPLKGFRCSVVYFLSLCRPETAVAEQISIHPTTHIAFSFPL